MHWFLGLFDPGWRDFAVKNATAEITVIAILAALVAIILYHFIFGRKRKVPTEWLTKHEAVEKELQEEKSRHHKIKTQLEAAVSKANSFSSAAHEVEKLKTKIHDLQKDLDGSKGQTDKLRSDLASEHAKVTSLMVDHSEVEELKNRLKNQEKELGVIKTESKKMRGELENALSERAKLAAALNESQVNEMKTRMQRLENDLHSSRMLVVKYQTEANGIADEKKRIQEESALLETMKKDAEGIKTKLSTAEADLQKARQGLSELNQLKTQLQSLKSERDNWENEANAQARNAANAIELQDKLDKLDAQLKAAIEEKQNLAATSSDLTHLKTEQNQLRSKIAMLESDLLASKQAYEELEGKYEAGLKEADTAVKPDNLKRIEGIGPRIEELLHQNSIFTFVQLADTKPDQLQTILDGAGEQYRIHDPGTWPQQAKLLAEGKVEEFEKLTLELKGGRNVD